MSVETELVLTVLGTSGVAALIGARLYPLTRPQGVTLPAVRYQRISTVADAAHDGATGLAQCRFQFSIHASSYASAAAVAQALRRALHGQRGTVGPGSSTLVAGDLDDYEPTTQEYLRHVDVMVWTGNE